MHCTVGERKWEMGSSALERDWLWTGAWIVPIDEEFLVLLYAMNPLIGETHGHFSE